VHLSRGQKLDATCLGEIDAVSESRFVLSVAPAAAFSGMLLMCAGVDDRGNERGLPICTGHIALGNQSRNPCIRLTSPGFAPAAPRGSLQIRVIRCVGVSDPSTLRTVHTRRIV
jgi:hypothetical protein